MRGGEITNIHGSWSDNSYAWVTDTWCLTGDCWLEVTLPQKGRLVIKKAETENGPWPKVLISSWSGPEFRIRLYGSTKYRYVKIYLTDNPDRIQFVNTKGYACAPSD